MESRVRGRDDRAPARRPSAWEPLIPTPSPAVAPRPLLRPGPRSVMYVPLVVLAAVLPGLFALRNWDLNPPGPWWGLRALAALDGHVLDQVPAALAMGRGPEALAFRSVAMQPPLYAWLAAVGLGLGPDRSPLGAILPSYLAGAVVVGLVYRLGRLGGGPGLGLVAAALTGFSRDLLAQMQQPSPATLALAGALTALWGYGEYLASGVGGDRRRRRWAALAALGLAVSLMSVRMIGLATIPVVLLHRLAEPPERAPAGPRGSRTSWRRAWRAWSGLIVGAAMLAAALALASPWYLMMFSRYGREFLGALWEPPSLARPVPSGLLGGLVMAPATFPLALYAACRMLAGTLAAPADRDEPSAPDACGGLFWALWAGTAALLPSCVPGRPGPSLALFGLVPLNLLAARGMLDLARRRIPARSLIALAPATTLAVAWWTSSHVRLAVADLLAGHRPDAASALGLHLGLDVLIVTGLATYALDRWARRDDGRQRRVLGAFLAAVLMTTVAIGVREVRFRHRQTADLIALREMVFRRDGARPFDVVAVVGGPAGAAPGPGAADAEALNAGGMLRFVLRSALPGVDQVDLTRIDDLLDLPEGARLVILAGTRQRLPYPLQSRLGLEAIHPGRHGVLDAFATRLPDARPGEAD